MIKINLNRTRVTAGLEGETVVQDGGSESRINFREVGVKFFVMFIGVFALMIFERQNIDQLTQDLGRAQLELNGLKSQIAEKQGELGKLKDIEPLANGLNEKLRVLREYSKQRITELQSLDFMQSIIPERVWLRGIRFDKHRYQVVGNSVETVDLTDFVNKLENSAYFKDVIVIQDRERGVANGKIRDWEFTAREQAAN
jgi:Tfp pilus assembly protein PilN